MELLILSNISIWHIEFLLLIVLLIGFFRSFMQRICSDEYTTLNHLLTASVSIYKVNIYVPKLNKLHNTYDLDENSQTNASKLFNENSTKLLNESCNDIIKHYLNSQILTKLYKYYSEAGIIITILSILQED